jgi:hypothetical protein
MMINNRIAQPVRGSLPSRGEFTLADRQLGRSLSAITLESEARSTRIESREASDP